MKSIKQIALTVLLTIGAFSAITYTACNKDACSGVTCNNGGTCSGGTCTCQTGYEGVRCDTLSRTKFLGVYTGQETCTVGTDNYSVTLSSNSSNLNITYQNLYNQGFTATCTVTGPYTFSFTGSSNTTSYSGTGTLNNNQLTVSYQISNSATSTSNSCTYIGNK
ncbi:MAG: hypothetical protein P4L41_07395 [Flavipsychrobacter sp.]|nr:hypothetical protein [Flavipsychrobacter sp.]